ncbi:MAG: glycosyltransferase family 2 protein [Gammaproteobacteria bacterium]|nr:glycosyltransferase family 2 protein [Gammaproteobacteria bacterium]
MKSIVVIPARNEIDTVDVVIKEIKACFSGDVLVVDDASTDGTARAARAAGAEVLSLMFSLGAWGAIQAGLRYALKNDYQAAITMDADGQHEAASLSALQAPIAAGEADVVIGAYPKRGSFARRVAWSMFRSLSGLALDDLTSGLRAYNHAAIKLLASPKATLLDYQDMGVLLLLKKANLHICEVPVAMNDRVSGHSRIFSSWLAVGKYMLYTCTLCAAKNNYKRSFFKS